MKPRLFTIGYEGRTAGECLSLLRSANAGTLLDVRRLPLSRKRGLSKSALAAGCDEAGLDYVHDARLGTPRELMERLRREGAYDWDEYEAFLASQTEAIVAATLIAADRPTALLCYEANPADCHRNIVARYVAAEAGLQIVHL